MTVQRMAKARDSIHETSSLLIKGERNERKPSLLGRRRFPLACPRQNPFLTPVCISCTPQTSHEGC